MKNLTFKALRFTSLAFSLVLSLSAYNAKAQQGYFDVNGTATTYGTVDGSTYSWDDPNWAPSSGGTTATASWVQGDFARFYGPGSYTVNVGATEQMVGLYLNNTGVLTLGDNGGQLNIVSTANSAGDVVNNLDGSFYQGFLISFTSSSAAVAINSVVSGPGGIEQEGIGNLFLNNHNTYAGGTETTGGQRTYYKFGDSFGTGHIVINGGGQSLINNSGTALTVANRINFVGASDAVILGNAPGGSTIFSGVQTLRIGANGVNNQLTGDGTGSVEFNGSFSFDLTAADNTQGNLWHIVDTANLNATYGSAFTVDGFTQNGNLWTSGDYQFSEGDGTLTVVPEPSTAALGLLGGLAAIFARRRK